ncbi:hypothetical protein ASF15_02155 [Pseudomonas sp. Leaf83]|nr:hypothetical protein ASF15_02155 [Pseudomonas sp. Leaf83]
MFVPFVTATIVSQKRKNRWAAVDIFNTRISILVQGSFVLLTLAVMQHVGQAGIRVSFAMFVDQPETDPISP